MNLYYKIYSNNVISIGDEISLSYELNDAEKKSGNNTSENVKKENSKNSFTVIKSIPVPNGAIVFNVKSLNKDDQAKIKAALLSKETYENPAIFSAKTSKIRGMFLKESDKVGFC